MAKVQIVIEIDKRAWMDEKSIREAAFEYEHGCAFDRAIREGLRQAIIIPEGHGRLIDEKDIVDRFKPPEKYKFWKTDLGGLFVVLKETPTIIEGSDSE